jgi:hypothetical protein
MKGMGMKIAPAAIGIGAALALALAPQAAADPGIVFFQSPQDGLNCEVDWQQGDIPDQVYCQTYSPPQTVRMDINGVLTTCKNFDRPAGTSTCNLGDPPPGTPTLAYGQTNATGPFKCASETAGMTCTVPTGLGFTMSGAGITPVG